MRKKIRHAETVDADIVGYTGPGRAAARSPVFAVRLPDGRIALTLSLRRLLGQEALASKQMAEAAALALRATEA